MTTVNIRAYSVIDVAKERILKSTSSYNKKYEELIEDIMKTQRWHWFRRVNVSREEAIEIIKNDKWNFIHWEKASLITETRKLKSLIKLAAQSADGNVSVGLEFSYLFKDDFHD